MVIACIETQKKQAYKLTCTVSPVNNVGASFSTPYSSANTGLAEKMIAAAAIEANTGASLDSTEDFCAVWGGERMLNAWTSDCMELKTSRVAITVADAKEGDTMMIEQISTKFVLYLASSLVASMQKVALVALKSWEYR